MKYTKRRGGLVLVRVFLEVEPVSLKACVVINERQSPSLEIRAAAWAEY